MREIVRAGVGVLVVLAAGCGATPPAEQGGGAAPPTPTRFADDPAFAAAAPAGVAWIGSDRVDWSPGPERAGALEADWTWTVRGERLLLGVEVRNPTASAVYRAVVRVEVSAMRRAPSRQLTIHVGRVAAKAAARRQLVVTIPALKRSGAVLRLHVGGRARREALSFPLPFSDAAAYHAAVRRIFEAGVKAIRAATGKPFTPRLGKRRVMGFQAGAGTVYYQDPFALDAATRRINEAVMQVRDPELFRRHAQMMPFWFIPHELVHCARPRPGSWYEELVANLAQPLLTARILDELDAPYTPAFMRAVYARYSRALRGQVTDAQAKSVERYVRAMAPRGMPFPGHPNAMQFFATRTAPYVYFIARANLFTLERHTAADLNRLLTR